MMPPTTLPNGFPDGRCSTTSHRSTRFAAADHQPTPLASSVLAAHRRRSTPSRTDPPSAERSHTPWLADAIAIVADLESP
jgi:hypothetical protein